MGADSVAVPCTGKNIERIAIVLLHVIWLQMHRWSVNWHKIILLFYGWNQIQFYCAWDEKTVLAHIFLSAKKPDALTDLTSASNSNGSPCSEFFHVEPLIFICQIFPDNDASLTNVRYRFCTKSIPFIVCETVESRIVAIIASHTRTVKKQNVIKWHVLNLVLSILAIGALEKRRWKRKEKK